MFCRIVSRQLPSQVVHESEDVMGIRDIQPQAPVHALFIPKSHTANLNDAQRLAPGMLERLIKSAVAYAAEAGVRDSGYRLVFNVNKDGGQSVDHLHLHVLGGRAMNWPPG